MSEQERSAVRPVEPTDDEPVLLFTEYKATQALVHEALEARFGKGRTGFINGDERLVVICADGTETNLPLSKTRLPTNSTLVGPDF